MFRNPKYLYGDDDISVPYHINYGKYVLSYLRKKDSEIALANVATGEQMTYKEVTEYSVSLSLRLSALGVGRGDVVALGAENRVEFVPAAIGIICAGACVSGITINSGRANLLHFFNLTKAKYMVCTQKFWNLNKDTLRGIYGVKLYLIIDGNDEILREDPKLVKFNMINNVDIDKFEPTPVHGLDDIAAILFSSGTTGLPKGVLLTHLNCITSTHADLFADQSLSTAGMMGVFEHNYDFFMTVKFWILGARVVYHPEPLKLYDFIDEWKINIVLSMPWIMNTFAKDDNFGKKKMDSLKIIYCRSSVLHAKTAEVIKQKLPSLKMLAVGLGMTECGEPASYLWSKSGVIKEGSAGVVAPGIIMKVVDLTSGQPLGPNEHGEICVKGPQRMKGYIDIEPSKYEDDEGFYKTGDLGYYDEDGYVFIIDRIKDVINHCGFKLSPQAIENIIIKHPAIQEVSVIGKPDLLSIELAMAFVVKKPGFTVTYDELVEFMRPELSEPELLPGGVQFIEKLPRNARGKVLKTELRKIIQ